MWDTAKKGTNQRPSEHHFQAGNLDIGYEMQPKMEFKCDPGEIINKVSTPWSTIR